MLIDWFTVVAQIINFVVLVALLKHFLWDRLVHAIDEREKRVAIRLSSAEEAKNQAQQQMELIRSEKLDLEQKRDLMIAQAKHDADTLRNELTQEVRKAVEQQELKWHQDLERGRENFLNEVRRRTAKEILGVVRRALADLASSDLQHCAMEAFLEKLRTFDVAALHDLANGELAVRSPQEIPQETREKIQNVLQERLRKPVRLKFERAAEMPWGIELRGNGLRVGWNPDSYVDSLQENLNEALERHAEEVPETIVK
jgi:F-type H+-transporting ATPase subunit b